MAVYRSGSRRRRRWRSSLSQRLALAATAALAGLVAAGYAGAAASAAAASEETVTYDVGHGWRYKLSARTNQLLLQYDYLLDQLESPPEGSAKRFQRLLALDADGAIDADGYRIITWEEAREELRRAELRYRREVLHQSAPISGVGGESATPTTRAPSAPSQLRTTAAPTVPPSVNSAQSMATEPERWDRGTLQPAPSVRNSAAKSSPPPAVTQEAAVLNAPPVRQAPATRQAVAAQQAPGGPRAASKPPAVGTPAVGTPAVKTPAVGGSAAGAPAVGTGAAVKVATQAGRRAARARTAAATVNKRDEWRPWQNRARYTSPQAQRRAQEPPKRAVSGVVADKADDVASPQPLGGPTYNGREPVAPDFTALHTLIGETWRHN